MLISPYPSSPITPPGAGNSKRSMRSILYNLQEKNNQKHIQSLLKEMLDNDIIDITAEDLKNVIGTFTHNNKIKNNKTLEKVFNKLNDVEKSIHNKSNRSKGTRPTKKRRARKRRARKRPTKKRRARKRPTKKRR